jgi:hypothetical protein
VLDQPSPIGNNQRCVLVHLSFPRIPSGWGLALRARILA